jgi:hypothetical protein
MATIQGLTVAASLMPVSVETGNEARPSTTARVLWIGGSTKPIHMNEGDVWWRVQTTAPSAPSFVTTSLNTITQGVLFSQTLVLNGALPMTFSVAAGALPAGLSLNSSTGTISGTPSASGSYSFTVQATNAIGSDTQAYSGTVTASPVAPTITTTALTTLTQGSAFTQTLNATGTGPLTWTISGGTFPTGLTLNSSTGIISGTPTGSGSYSFTVRATNSAGFDDQAYTGTIEATGTAPTITTTALAAMQEGFSFSQTLARTGSTPMTWGISAGTLPSGLTINSSTGVISGTPTVDGAYSFTVQATNSFGSDTQAFSGTIDPPADADVYSIFGSAATGSLTSHTDADVGAWVSTQFYTASTGVAAGSKIIGARLYVPAGSAHIGQTWYGALITNASGYYPGLGTLPYAQYDSNGSKKAGSALVEGWNEVIFDLEYDVPAVGGSWLIGTQIGNGSRYLHDTTLSASSIQNVDGKNFHMSEVTGSGVSRSFYQGSASGGSTRWYGSDTLVSIPA